MRFQLVLKCPAASLKNFDEIVGLEGVLIAKFSDQNEVDGHDFGSSEANIFVLTDDPHRTFDEAKNILSGHRLWPDLKIAYRQVNGTEYHVLWPEHTTRFDVR